MVRHKTFQYISKDWNMLSIVFWLPWYYIEINKNIKKVSKYLEIKWLAKSQVKEEITQEIRKYLQWIIRARIQNKEKNRKRQKRKREGNSCALQDWLYVGGTLSALRHAAIYDSPLVFTSCLHGDYSQRWKFKVFSDLLWMCNLPWTCVYAWLSKYSSPFECLNFPKKFFLQLCFPRFQHSCLPPL